jgi:hypothetical protein
LVVTFAVHKHNANNKDYRVQGNDGGFAHFFFSTLVLGSFRTSKGTSKRLI